MELAPSGVRVNTIHPDAVFDTGVWSDEILQARAKKYGMSVAEYKTRNLLKANITSKDVAKAIFLLIGSSLSATTERNFLLMEEMREHSTRVLFIHH